MRRLARYQGIMFTTRRSNQIKKTKEELKELRKPIDDFLEKHGFDKDHIANTDWGS